MKLIENKKLILSIGVLVLIISIAGGSLAKWSWGTDNTQKTLVTVQLEESFLTISGGNVQKTGMYPTKYCSGDAAIIGDIATVTAENNANLAMKVILKIRATLSISHSSLSDTNKSKINWAIIETSEGTTCETTQYKGTLSGVTTNTDIDTGINFIVPADATVTKSYRIYVWVDSTYTHTNEDEVISDPMQELGIKVQFSPGSQLIQTAESIAADGNAITPVLDSGMIPVKIANNGTVTTVSSTDSTWYNYDNKQWANAVLVKSSGTKTRDYYKSNTGVTVPESDILAYYVWIPRYKYRISGKCSEVTNPSVTTNPGCYAPYTISNTDKSNLAAFLQIMSSSEFGVDLTIDEATYLVESALQTGSLDLGDMGKYTINEVIGLYNSNMGGNIAATPSAFNANNTTTGPNTIDIVFEPKNAIKSTGDAVNTYYTHPAFIWDGNYKSGIWVGKFESTGDVSTPTIKPNSSPLTDQNVYTKFTTSLKFAGGVFSVNDVTFAGNSTYGLISTTDSHMMKNSEWGAVAYLSHSKYGINNEVRINSAFPQTTGCGAAIENNTDNSIECQIVYGSGVSSYPQSTTGNITGVFDMSGGAGTVVMGNYGNNYNINRDGFVILPPSKYYDYYSNEQFNGGQYTNMFLCTLETCGGHSLIETHNWYLDDYDFVNYTRHWFTRSYGGAGKVLAGMFAYGSTEGQTGNSWRSVLIVD